MRPATKSKIKVSWHYLTELESQLKLHYLRRRQDYEPNLSRLSEGLEPSTHGCIGHASFAGLQRTMRRKPVGDHANTGQPLTLGNSLRYLEIDKPHTEMAENSWLTKPSSGVGIGVFSILAYQRLGVPQVHRAECPFSFSIP